MQFFLVSSKAKVKQFTKFNYIAAAYLKYKRITKSQNTCNFASGIISQSLGLCHTVLLEATL